MKAAVEAWAQRAPFGRERPVQHIVGSVFSDGFVHVENLREVGASLCEIRAIESVEEIFGLTVDNFLSKLHDLLDMEESLEAVA